MENKSYSLIDRIDYLEFRQNVLLLKQPSHKASIFFDLDISTFLKIREFSRDFSRKVTDGEKLTLINYEKSLINIWAPISTYPSSYLLIAKSLLDRDVYELLVKNS